MRRRRTTSLLSLTFAGCVLLSLLAHAGGFAGLAVWYDTFAPSPPASGQAASTRTRVIEPMPTPDPIALPPLPDEPDRLVFGERGGQGELTNSAPGERGGRPSVTDQADTHPLASNAPPVRPQRDLLAAPPRRTAAPTLLRAPDFAGLLPEGSPAERFEPGERAEPAEAVAEEVLMPTDADAAEAEPPTPADGEAGRDGQATPAAEPQPAEAVPANPGDSALAATTTDVTLTVGRGGEAREGRAHKLAPFDRFLHIREQVTAAGLPQSIVTRVSLDDEGHVVDVTFLRPSPSAAFNHALRLMLYASWFEPVDGANTFRFTLVLI